MSDLQHGTAVLDDAYRRITTVVVEADATGRRLPTRTAWNVRELLVHILLDAQRCLITLATPADRQPDTDRNSYWDKFARARSDHGAEQHRQWVAAVAAAYAHDEGLLAHWTETSSAAVRAVAAASDGVVETQGHALRTADFVDTLVVEATIHHLDLTTRLAGPPPGPEGLTRAADVVRALTAVDLPSAWSDLDVVLRGTGRVPLTPDERTAVGDRLPILL